MKIAHVNMFYLPTFGGVEQVMYELAQRQIRDGHEVHVYCCDSDKYGRVKKKHEIIEGVHVHRLPYWFRLSYNTFFWPSLLWKMKEKFDVVHTHVAGHDYILFTGILAKIKGFKHVHTTHCPWTDTSFRPPILRPFLILNDLFMNRLSFNFVDKIFPITPWESDKLDKYIKNKNKIKVIPNGTDKILYEKITDNQYKKKNNIKEKYMVLFFGRLNPTKAPQNLAKAAINITKKRKDIAFVWVGPDEGKMEEVKKLIAPYPNMHCLGAIRGKENIAEMYQAADMYVLPSYREGLPLTLFEAMASGLPIVASPVNGIPYEMKEPENGFFTPYGDIDAIEKRILQLLEDPELAKEISENNYKKSKDFDWDIIHKRYMEEYKKLLSKKVNYSKV
jgi:glycosyltransferase involved in cell wall biosynthesis